MIERSARRAPLRAARVVPAAAHRLRVHPHGESRGQWIVYPSSTFGCGDAGGCDGRTFRSVSVHEVPDRASIPIPARPVRNRGDRRFRSSSACWNRWVSIGSHPPAESSSSFAFTCACDRFVYSWNRRRTAAWGPSGAAVHLFDDGRTVGDVLDVHLGVVDPDLGRARLEPTAVARTSNVVNIVTATLFGQELLDTYVFSSSVEHTPDIVRYHHRQQHPARDCSRACRRVSRRACARVRSRASHAPVLVTRSSPGRPPRSPRSAVRTPSPVRRRRPSAPAVLRRPGCASFVERDRVVNGGVEVG